MNITGTASPASSHSLSESRAIARNSDSAILPNTSMARSNMFTPKISTRPLRTSTPPASAHTNCGNWKDVPCATLNMMSENARQAANMASVCRPDSAVMRRCWCGRSNTTS